MVDMAVVVPSSSTQRIQELHITVGHIICGALERRAIDNGFVTQSGLEALLNHLERRPFTVLVLGDAMCDNYIFGKINRISPEAPVPIFESTEQFRRLGGAGNVAANLRALGCNVRLLGVVGGDAGATRVKALLHE
jgi:hypothetical protein